jgi:hypothetical protein
MYSAQGIFQYHFQCKKVHTIPNNIGYVECHYAECCYSECRHAECRGTANVIGLQSKLNIPNIPNVDCPLCSIILSVLSTELYNIRMYDEKTGTFQ